MSDHPASEIDPSRPNDPLRIVLPMEGWPPGQPPVTPLGDWGPASAGTIQRAWYWKPELLRGYVPILKRIQVNTIDASLPTPEFSAAVAPRILIAFLDPNQDETPSGNQEFSAIPSGLFAPKNCEVLFFAPAGTVLVVNATNDGAGYEFPMRSPDRYCGIWVSASRIGMAAQVSVTPVIHYVRKGVGQGG